MAETPTLAEFVTCHSYMWYEDEAGYCHAADEFLGSGDHCCADWQSDPVTLPIFGDRLITFQIHVDYPIVEDTEDTP